MEAASLKPEIPIPKKSKSPNLRKESMRVLNWDLRIVSDLELGTWDLLRIRSPGSSSRSPHLGIVNAFWFSFCVDAAAGIIGLRFCGARRQVGERFGVGTLRTCGPVKLRKRRIVSEKRLQLRCLRREQLDLGVEDIQLHPCASVQARLGQTQRFVS